MKPFITLLLITSVLFVQTFAQVPPQSGKVSIRMHGIICNRETGDELFAMDGVGDEISLNFVHVVNAGPNTLAPVRNIYSPKLGEVNNSMSLSERYSREKAGTATPNGGLKTGDSYNFSGLRYIIMNERVNTSSLVMVCPSIWESDHETEASFPTAIYYNTLKNTMGSIFFQENIRKLMLNPPYAAVNNELFQMQGAATGLDNQIASMLKAFDGKQCSRPVGVDRNNEFKTTLLVLNIRMMQWLASKDFGYGVGFIPITFSDIALGNTRNQGIYTLLLKIDFTPDPVNTPTPPPPPPPPTRISTIPVKTPVTDIRNIPVKNNLTPVTSATPVSVTGNWSGNLPAGKMLKTGTIFFIFIDDGSLRLQDVNRNILGTGTYSFLKGQLNGSYTTGNSEVISFTGTLNGSTLTGTWGNNKASTGGGNWILNRQ